MRKNTQFYLNGKTYTENKMGSLTEPIQDMLHIHQPVTDDARQIA